LIKGVRLVWFRSYWKTWSPSRSGDWASLDWRSDQEKRIA